MLLVNICPGRTSTYLWEMSHVVAKRAGMEEDQLKSGLSKLLTDLQAVEE